MKRAFFILVVSAFTVLLFTAVDHALLEKKQPTEIYLSRMDEAVKHGDFSSAIFFAEAAVKNSPKDPMCWRALANANAVRAMNLFTINKSHHLPYLKAMLVASKQAVKLSDEWSYKKDMLDNYLFAIYYGMDLYREDVLEFVRTFPLSDQYDANMDRNVTKKKVLMEKWFRSRKAI